MFCCDYDALTTYEPGSFCAQYRTDLTGKIERANLKEIKDPVDLNSFLNQSYESYITTAPLILYRAFGVVKRILVKSRERGHQEGLFQQSLLSP